MRTAYKNCEVTLNAKKGDVETAKRMIEETGAAVNTADLGDAPYRIDAAPSRKRVLFDARVYSICGIYGQR